MIIVGLVILVVMIVGIVYLLDEPPCKPVKPHRFPEFEQQFFSTKKNR